MKNKHFLTITIFLFVAVGSIIWYIKPSYFLKNTVAEDIKYIHITNGNNGSNYTIGDKKQISFIFDNIKNISFKKTGISIGKKGYKFKLNFEDKNGKIISKFIINSNNIIRKDPFFYYDENNSVCAEYIGNILLFDFYGINLNEEQSFLATVIEETPSYIIVEPYIDEYERIIYDKIKVEYSTDRNKFLYGIGRKVIIYYKGRIEANEPATIKTDDISSEGFREFSLNITPSDKKEKVLAVSEKMIYADTNTLTDMNNIDYNVYFYGTEGIGVEVDGKNMSLEKACNLGLISINGIISKANKDAEDGLIKTLVYKDGGSKVYKYPDYTIIKYHTLDGNRDVYIGTTDMDINVMNK